MYTKEHAIYLAKDSKRTINRIIIQIEPSSDMPANWKTLIINHVNRALWILDNYESEIKIEQRNRMGIESFTLSRAGFGEDGLSIEYEKDSFSGDITKLYYFITENMTSSYLEITLKEKYGSAGYLILKNGKTRQEFYCDL